MSFGPDGEEALFEWKQHQKDLRNAFERGRRIGLHDGWNEGYIAGHSNAMRKMSDEPNAPKSPNPYAPVVGTP